MKADYDTIKYTVNSKFDGQKDEIIKQLRGSGIQSSEDIELLLELIHLWNHGYVEYDKFNDKYIVNSVCKFNYGKYKRFLGIRKGFVNLERIVEKYDLWTAIIK